MKAKTKKKAEKPFQVFDIDEIVRIKHEPGSSTERVFGYVLPSDTLVKIYDIKRIAGGICGLWVFQRTGSGAFERPHRIPYSSAEKL